MHIALDVWNRNVVPAEIHIYQSPQFAASWALPKEVADDAELLGKSVLVLTTQLPNGGTTVVFVAGSADSVELRTFLAEHVHALVAAMEGGIRAVVDGRARVFKMADLVLAGATI